MYVPWISLTGLIIALIPGLPYGYYQLLRWLVCGSSCYGIILCHQKNRQSWKWAFVGLAVLFNPLLPIHLSRDVWFFADIAASIIFAISSGIFKESSSNTPLEQSR